jgi:hypothetical protein
MNSLYRLLVVMEKPALAAPIGRMMLDLCPNDNIGIRFTIEAVEASITSAEVRDEMREQFEDEDADALLA